MTDKRKIRITAALIAAGAIMPAAGMYIMLKTDMIAISFLIGVIETIIGGAVCAQLYGCGNETDEDLQENGL